MSTRRQEGVDQVWPVGQKRATVERVWPNLLELGAVGRPRGAVTRACLDVMAAGVPWPVRT